MRPPPEDLRAEQPRLESRTVLHFGDAGVLHDSDCLIGVDHQFLRFSFGSSCRFVGLWSSNLCTPRFTVDGYVSKNTTVVASLRADDLESCLPLADLFEIVVSVDGSRRMREFATDRGLVLFEGADALFWAVHRVLTT